MAVGLSEKIRSMARMKYVDPAMRSGHTRFSIRVRDLISDLQAEGIPPTYTPQICSALQTRKFLVENGLEIEEVEGPPKKVSPTVVIKYRVQEASGVNLLATADHVTSEDPSTRAFRLTEKLRGILKDELAEYGGGEAFLRWIRSDDEEAA